jgi:predicted alpha/beta-hydrolase family hydrolase
MSTTRTVATPRGPARLHADPGTAGLLVLGHGAGGGPDAPDLLAARDGAQDAGWAVVRVEQPWRVAGRRVAEAPVHLDTAWTAVVRDLAQRPLVLGGRSSGARVACRTARELGAAAVLALAFPLVPPGRDVSRAAELALPQVPVLVVQGERDAFAVPVGAEVVAGADHAFAVRRRDDVPDPLVRVRDLVRAFLQTVT